MTKSYSRQWQRGWKTAVASASKQGAEFLLSGLLVCQQQSPALLWPAPPTPSGLRIRLLSLLGHGQISARSVAVCERERQRPCGRGGLVGPVRVAERPRSVAAEFERRLERPANGDFGPIWRIDHAEQARLARLIDAYERLAGQGRIRAARPPTKSVWLTSRSVGTAPTGGQRRGIRLLVGEFENFAQQMTDGLEQTDFAVDENCCGCWSAGSRWIRTSRIVYKVQPALLSIPANRGVLQIV